MRTSERAVQQVRWDPRLAPSRFTVVVDVHRPEPKRIPLPEFVPGGDIPWHRVLAIELDGAPVWDRATGVDRLDELATTGVARPQLLVGTSWRIHEPVRWGGRRWQALPPSTEAHPERARAVTWNVLWDRFEPGRPDATTRWERLLDAALAEGPQLIALQEVTPAVHALVAADPRVREAWWLSHPPGHPDIERYDLLLLGRGPVEQVGLWPLGPHKAVLAAAIGDVVWMTVHLTSSHAARAAVTRASQLDELGQLLAAIQGPVVVLGDFNLPDEDAPLPLHDAWLDVHGAPQPTFDPTTNALAQLGSLSGRPHRLDRVLVRGLHPHAIAQLGTAPVDGLWLSDHYGLRVDLDAQAPPEVLDAPPSVRSALAWLPDDADAIQAVRADHDPSHPRWPAHLNLLWGFVDEASLPAAAPRLEAALAATTPFTTRLAEVQTFTHAATASHGLVPEQPEPFIALHRQLRRAFPRCGRPTHSPHLTFARTPPGGRPPRVPALGGEVRQLAVLTRRGDEPFAVRATLPLGGPLSFVPEPPWPPGEPAPAEALGQLPGAVVVGSRALGVAIDGTDLDLVFPDHEPDAVRAALTPHVDGLFAVTKAGLPGFRAWRGALQIDAVPGGDDPRARSAIDDTAAVRAAIDGRTDAFVRLTRAVKAWARAQALDDPAFGGIEGLALAVLCARTVREVSGSDDDLLYAFFATWAARDWSRPVGLRNDPPGHGFAILTPTAPIRNIAERVVLPRFEQALLEAWELLDSGASRHDLWRPLPFHRRFASALEVCAADRRAQGVARGRARALIELTGGVPCPGRPLLLGLPGDGSDAFVAAQAWAEGLDGVTVALRATAEVGSPGRG